jgi:hypothetical protein
VLVCGFGRRAAALDLRRSHHRRRQGGDSPTETRNVWIAAVGVAVSFWFRVPCDRAMAGDGVGMAQQRSDVPPRT